MSICKDDKSYLKNNLISFLTSVKEKLLYTVCHEIPCTFLKWILKAKKKNNNNPMLNFEYVDEQGRGLFKWTYVIIDLKFVNEKGSKILAKYTLNLRSGLSGRVGKYALLDSQTNKHVVFG